MLRVVLDSSVLISAFLTPRGTSAELLRAADRAAFALCLSHEIIAETTRSLRQKTERIRRYYPNYSNADVDWFAQMLAGSAEVVEKLPELRVVPLDAKDDVIVATASRHKPTISSAATATFLRSDPMAASGSSRRANSSICYDRLSLSS